MNIQRSEKIKVIDSASKFRPEHRRAACRCLAITSPPDYGAVAVNIVRQKV
jgi:hypothetical protein